LTLKKLKIAKKNNNIFFIVSVLFGALTSCHSNDSKVRELTREQSSKLNLYIEPIESIEDFNKFGKDEFEVAICTNIHINNILKKNKLSVDYSTCKNFNQLNNYKKYFYITSFFERNLFDNKKTIVSVLDSNYGHCNLWRTLAESYREYKFLDIAMLIENLNTYKNTSKGSLLIDSIYSVVKTNRSLFMKYRMKQFQVNKKYFLTNK
jgi:hypothetical protein